MIILITGATHTGKTRLAQRIMEKKHIPYLSQDHLKMGLIRCGYASITPDASDETMTEFLWPFTREIIKTAIENRQNLIIEGCYIPFDWKTDFSDAYRREINYICLCLSSRYIHEHYMDIKRFAGCIESRIDDGYCTEDLLIRENARFRENCAINNLPATIIDADYEKTICRMEEALDG